MSKPDSTVPAAVTSDGHLMKQIAAGNADAFGQLYDRYCGRAYGVARSVCRDAGRSEDAVQEAFVSIWRNRLTYRPDRGTVASWLLCVVHYRAIDVARRDSKHADRRVGDYALEARPAPGDLAERVVAREHSVHLEALLRGLPEAQREVIVLAFYGQLTHAEIARQLDLPAGTVKGRMRMGLQKLRAELDQAA